MQITATFNTLEEFQQFISRGVTLTTGEAEQVLQDLGYIKTAPEEPQEVAAAETAPEEKKDTAKKKRRQEAADTTAEAPTATEADRVKVRQLLAKLNKAAGKNKAREIIQGLGYDKLTDVPLEDLPKLLELTEGALRDAN